MNETTTAPGPATSRPTRILLVNNSADVYGASRCLLRLAKLLDRTKFEPVVLMPEHGPLENELRAAQIQTIIFPELSVIDRSVLRPWPLVRFALNLPRSVFALRRIITGQRIGLVHTNTGVMLAPGFAARLAGVPHVWHIRDWFQEFRGFWKIYARCIRALSARIVAVSGAVAGQFPESYGVDVVHDGIDVGEFDLADAAAGAKFRVEHGVGDSPVAGCVGRIKLVRKGQEVLLQAAALLKRRGVQARYLIVGSPYPGNESHLEKLHEIVRDAGMGADVVFTGELLDPRPAYAAMDVFVLPSAQTEPFGGVVTEAMCMRLPVVATNIGGPVEQVLDGETGYLVPPLDPAALADRLETLFRDADMRKRFGEAGRQRARQSFRLTEMMKKIERIYDECLVKK